MSQIVTPAQIEKRLYELSKEIDDSNEQLSLAELSYNNIKADYEIAMAKSRIMLASKSSPTGKNYTVGEREDLAIVENSELHYKMAIAEAQVKAARANVARIRTQVDIARSLGTSVRTSMDL